MSTRPLLAPCMAAMVVLAACQGETAVDETLANSCRSQQGFEISYPADWEANAHPVAGFPPCSLFDPESVAPTAQAIHLTVAVVAAVEEGPFDLLTGEHDTALHTSREEVVIDGRTAVRIEAEATGDDMRAPGSAMTAWYVDLDTGTFVATTQERDGRSYAQTQAVLDAMMETVTFTRPTAGAGMPG